MLTTNVEKERKLNFNGKRKNMIGVFIQRRVYERDSNDSPP